MLGRIKFLPAINKLAELDDVEELLHVQEDDTKQAQELLLIQCENDDFLLPKYFS